MSEKEFIYGHVLEALSGGLYPNKLDVIREYLQNSYDEIVDYVRKADTSAERARRSSRSKVVVSVKGGSFFIHDNCKGMDFQTLNEYRKIGFSRKPFGEYAGWRGIGKAAGLAVAEKLIVTTSQGLGQTFQLVFDAKEMTQEVHDLRALGKNIPFGMLIEKHSQIKTFEEGNESFTTVELHKIRDEAKKLLDRNQIIAHLSNIAPVPFDPKFKYAHGIQKQLQMVMEDYVPLNLYFDDVQIFKPFLETWTTDEGTTRIDPPDFVSVYDEEGENIIAFCWYCMHSDKGRIKFSIPVNGVPVNVSGPVYRLRDIKIGDSDLVKTTLFTTTPQRSVWAVGEIHVLDESVEPTSDRNDFLDNHARYMLYKRCRIIAQEISRKADVLSQETKAKTEIEKADERIQVISSAVAAKTISKAIIPAYIYEATALKKEAEKRKPKTPEAELREKADNIIKTADSLVKQLTNSLAKPDVPENRVHKDIMEELGIDEQGRAVYSTVIATLQDYYANEPETLEELIRRIERALLENLSS